MPVDIGIACRVSITVECLNLPVFKVGNKNMVQVTCEQISEPNICQVIGQTEPVETTFDPSFATPFVVEYCFHQLQLLQFTVYYYCKNEKYALGAVRCTLGELLKSPFGKAHKTIQILSNEELKEDPLMVIRVGMVTSNISLMLELSASNLGKKDLGPFTKLDPYLELSREEPDGRKMLVYRTEVVHKTLNPTWMLITVPVHSMCKSDYKEPIVITCYDWNKNSSPNFIGEIRTTVEQLFKERHHYFINPKKYKKKNYSNSGTLNVIRIEESKCSLEAIFLDYLSGESYLSLMMGIDYTRSNGLPSEPTSLHYHNPCGALNPYCQAVYNIGNVLLPYTADNTIEMYGFGALLSDGTTSHCLEIANTSGQHGIVGIHAALSAYYQSLTWITLHGPTNLAPLIRKASDKAQTYHSKKNLQQTYLILLILTDGDIDDASETINAIAAASYLPISILIVGIGNDDFKTIKKLDADNSDCQITKVVSRDIVTFIEFKYICSVQQLTSEILRKIPFQFTSYMKQNNIAPKPRVCYRTTVSPQSEYQLPTSQPEYQPSPSQSEPQSSLSHLAYQSSPSQSVYQPSHSQPVYQQPPSQPVYQPSPPQPESQSSVSQPEYQPPPSQLEYQPSLPQANYDTLPATQRSNPKFEYRPPYETLPSRANYPSSTSLQPSNSQFKFQPTYQQPPLQSNYQPPPQSAYQQPSPQLTYTPQPSQNAYIPNYSQLSQNAYMPNYPSPQLVNQQPTLQQPVPTKIHGVPVAPHQPTSVPPINPSFQQQPYCRQNTAFPYPLSTQNTQHVQPLYGHAPAFVSVQPTSYLTSQSVYPTSSQSCHQQPTVQLNPISQSYPASSYQSVYAIQPQSSLTVVQTPSPVPALPPKKNKSGKSKKQKKISKKLYPGQYYSSHAK